MRWIVICLTMVLKIINSKKKILQKCSCIMFRQCFARYFSWQYEKDLDIYMCVYGFSVDYDTHKYLMKNDDIKQRLEFFKKIFIAAQGFVEINGYDKMKYVSMSNQECTIISTAVDISIIDPLFYSYSVTVNKYSSSHNDIYNSCSKLCIPDVVKDMNPSVFNLIFKTNEMHYIS